MFTEISHHNGFITIVTCKAGDDAFVASALEAAKECVNVILKSNPLRVASRDKMVADMADTICRSGFQGDGKTLNFTMDWRKHDGGIRVIMHNEDDKDKEITLPFANIRIKLRGNQGDRWESGDIESDMEGYLPGETGSFLTSLILAHAIAGVDVEDPAYLEGIETAFDALDNNS